MESTHEVYRHRLLAGAATLVRKDAISVAAVQSRLPPSLFSAYLPTDLRDAKGFLDQNDRWR